MKSSKRAMIRFVLVLFCVCATSEIFSQQISQNITGTISDAITGKGLSRASVSVNNPSSSYSALTNDEGKFSMTVPVGRYQIVISYTGYQVYKDEVLVNAGKTSVVQVTLRESETVLDAIEITSPQQQDVPGLHSITIEKTNRVPANFFDPVRMITSYPGVVATNDQNNSIIVRGNSPNGLLWRLNGADIVNPNHLANAGTLSDRPAANGGGVNILSAQMLDRTDFYMGALPSNYGNAVAGVIDMKLRNGNTNDFEYTAQASLIGLDFAAEGPLSKNHNNSFVANYRYSTVGLLSAAGINFGDESITFQDFSFNTTFNQKNGGRFSLFGLWGASKNEFGAKAVAEQKEDKDNYNIDYSANTYAVGMNYNLPLTNGSFNASMALSNGDQNRNANLSQPLTTVQRRLWDDQYNSSNQLFSLSLNLRQRISDKTSVDMGMMTDRIDNDVIASRKFACLTCEIVDVSGIDGTMSGFLFQPYVNGLFELTSRLRLNTGLRFVYLTANHTNSFEPRVKVDYQLSPASTVNFSYSLTGQVQPTQIYLTPGNQNLGFTKSHHVDLDYHHLFDNNISLQGGIFYQHLFNVPVQTDSVFSGINLLEGFAPPNLTPNGTGDNYGVDFTIEKTFFAKNYILFGGSYYESKFATGDGIQRESRFNGNYTVNAVYGREWTKSEANRTIGLSARVLYLGGLRESSIDVAKSRQMGETYYVNTNPYSNKLPDYFRVDLRLQFRKNKPGYTRTFAIDLQNLTSQQNQAYHYFDLHQDKIVTKYQLGIIPVIVYRIDF